MIYILICFQEPLRIASVMDIESFPMHMVGNGESGFPWWESWDGLKNDTIFPFQNIDKDDYLTQCMMMAGNTDSHVWVMRKSYLTSSKVFFKSNLKEISPLFFYKFWTMWKILCKIIVLSEVLMSDRKQLWYRLMRKSSNAQRQFTQTLMVIL